MGTPVKNILITLLINTSSNLQEKVIRIKYKFSAPRSIPSLFRLGVLELFKHVFEYLMTISPPPTPPRGILFSLSGWSAAIAFRPLFLSIQKSKYQRDITSKIKQLCYLIRTSHSSRSLSGTGYFLRWNRRGEFEHWLQCLNCWKKWLHEDVGMVSLTNNFKYCRFN